MKISFHSRFYRRLPGLYFTLYWVYIGLSLFYEVGPRRPLDLGIRRLFEIVTFAPRCGSPCQCCLSHRICLCLFWYVPLVLMLLSYLRS